jgi:hypothetical protein
LVDGVVWGAGVLTGTNPCVAIDPVQYPLGNPSIRRESLGKDTDNCPSDFVIHTSALPGGKSANQ